MQPAKKTDPLILNKKQWLKVFTAMSAMVIVLYLAAMIFSLCGNKYFILNYQNAQMDQIEKWFADNHISILIHFLFSTFEFYIVLCFVLKKITRIWYPIIFYGIRVILAIPFEFPNFVNIIYPFIFYLLIPLIEQLIDHRSIDIKEYGKSLLRLTIAVGVTLILQAMILIIKAGYFDGQNHIMNLSATFIYAIEYDIALLVILYTVSLYINREKGDSICTTDQHLGGSSQTSKTQSQKSLLKKKLTKTQKNKLFWLYAKMYLIQLGTFLLVMVLPFLLGKVLEFLIMYVAFAITRYILGFQYSLHFKKESLCVSASLIVFGILSLAVPFFYVVVIMAVLIGTALAVLLHLSYKYKNLWLFNKVAKPDKFALLYTFFDGNLEKNYVKMICYYHGLDHFQTSIIIDFTRGEKISYMAKCRNYSQRMLIYKLDEAIDKLTK